MIDSDMMALVTSRTGELDKRGLASRQVIRAEFSLAQSGGVIISI